MKKREYTEGHPAQQNFERAMQALFKAPKKKVAGDASEKDSEAKKKQHASDKD